MPHDENNSALSFAEKYADSELIIGIVAAVGIDRQKVIAELESRLKVFNYKGSDIKISKDIIPQLVKIPNHHDEFKRIDFLMDAGNNARKNTNDNRILALGTIAQISANREIEDGHLKASRRSAIIVDSLKRPEEVAAFREVYGQGFFLLGIYSDEKRRADYLVKDKRLTTDQAKRLIERDAEEHNEFGQKTSDTFHLSDFFIHLTNNEDQWKNDLWRILDIIFGHPHKTPTFDEYAMFMAFSASLRSSDLSRQVGAVVAKDNEILATGANDCPKSGGGLYWPERNIQTSEIEDIRRGRDYMRDGDSNAIEKNKIIENIVDNIIKSAPDNKTRNLLLELSLYDVIKKSRISDITEYGRVVHAEMEALLTCSRNYINSRDAELFCTTFPCHNCAKHIIAAGIKRVVYVEPYPKSKTAEFHDDAISMSNKDNSNKVTFEPFVGIGPRRFLDLFSMRLGSGYPLKRKEKNGEKVTWKPEENGLLRVQLLPYSYLDLETIAAENFKKLKDI